jgi:hypothetical protein
MCCWQPCLSPNRLDRVAGTAAVVGWFFVAPTVYEVWGGVCSLCLLPVCVTWAAAWLSQAAVLYCRERGDVCCTVRFQAEPVAATGRQRASCCQAYTRPAGWAGQMCGCGACQRRLVPTPVCRLFPTLFQVLLHLVRQLTQLVRCCVLADCHCGSARTAHLHCRHLSGPGYTLLSCGVVGVTESACVWKQQLPSGMQL